MGGIQYLSHSALSVSWTLDIKSLLLKLLLRLLTYRNFKKKCHSFYTELHRAGSIPLSFCDRNSPIILPVLGITYLYKYCMWWFETYTFHRMMDIIFVMVQFLALPPLSKSTRAPLGRHTEISKSKKTILLIHPHNFQ